MSLDMDLATDMVMEMNTDFDKKMYSVIARAHQKSACCHPERARKSQIS